MKVIQLPLLFFTLLFTTALSITLFLSFPFTVEAAGQWDATGQMSVRHDSMRITELQNGKIMIAGGLNGNYSAGVTDVAELYDPATGQWTQTGNLVVGVGGNDRVVLNNGKVLFAGGTTSGWHNTPTAISQLYDPATGQWTQTGSLNLQRSNADMVKLQDGRVLIISGIDGGDFYNVTTTCELYDPATGQWTQTGSVNNPIIDSSGGNVVLLNDGKVLKVGNQAGSSSTVAELYDPATGQWTQTGSLLVGITSTKLIKLQNGKVLMAGGAQWGNFVTESELYDPATGQWTQTGSMNYARAGHDTLVFSDGKVFATGGLDINATFVLQSELYDPATGMWTVNSSVNTNSGFVNASMAMLPNGQILAASGSLQTAELYTRNIAPTVSAITASVNPIQVNTSITGSATFTDPAGELDAPYVIEWNWGDGHVDTSSVNQPGNVSKDHIYTTAGVYEVKLTVTDADSGTDTEVYQYLSVYAPTPNGTFSAGAKYDSPAGAYIQNPSLTGGVKFGFVYKYQGGVPSAQNALSLDFKNANLKFTATTVSSLVISNGVGTLTGTGQKNGQGTYNFLIVGNEATDTLRIKITDPANNNALIYDTQPGASDTIAPSTSVTPGHVVAN